MTTHSIVARVTDDCALCYIYVNFDGYINGVGAALVKHFNTDEMVCKLLELGDCSAIAEATNLDEVEAYHRDRGQVWDDTKPGYAETLQDMRDALGVSYYYVWDGQRWIAYNNQLEELVIPNDMLEGVSCGKI